MPKARITPVPLQEQASTAILLKPGEGITDQVGHQYAQRDTELVQRYDRAALLRGRNLREIERREHRGDADRHSNQETPDQKNSDVLCGC